MDEKLLRRCDEALRARGGTAALREGFHAHAAARPDAVEVDDLLVAYGAVRGERGCLDVLERDFFRELPRMVSRLRLGADDVAELSQRLRVELVVGGEARGPKLLSYGGRGPLGGFLRAVAMRTALSDLRRVVPKTEAFDGEIMGFATTHDDALENLSARHTQDLGAALRAAVGALSPRDRNVLRLYVLDGASIEVIGRLYGVHRATIARWVGEIRVRIARDAKARMLPLVSASEVTSIARLCYSQLDLSLDRLL